MVLLIPNLIHLISHPYNQSEKTIEIQHFIDDDLGLDVTSLDRDWRNLGLPAEGLYQVRHAYIRALVLVLRAAFEEEKKSKLLLSKKSPVAPRRNLARCGWGDLLVTGCKPPLPFPIPDACVR